VTGAARQAVFLDRDGVLNALVARDGRAVSPRCLEDFRLLPEAAAHVQRLRGRGLLIFVMTNQPDVARGHLAAADLEEMHRRLKAAFELDDLAVCPHDDADRCSCRKPQPGMLLALAERWGVDLRRSFTVGDGWKDIEAGRRAGCRTILIEGTAAGTGQDDCMPDRRVASLDEAVAVIESELGVRGVREAK
jgi:D-glycero-D-manno-heptose 1,7-bisphosphate phosphatase